jgi:putative pyruvate formate lyase activating enzyme
VSGVMSSCLRRYQAIVNWRSYARYLAARSIAVDRIDDLSIKELWEAHGGHLTEYRGFIEKNSPPELSHLSLLNLKRQIAQRLFTSCCFCEHCCNVDRRTDRGYCGVGKAHIASHFFHLGEEEPLVPSYTVFFAGCNLRCAFCQNYDISTSPGLGRQIPAQGMVAFIESAAKGGAKNINWVGGEPTPDLHYVLEVLSHAGTNIAQIWNSNMYLTKDALELLDGVVDVYLTDFKYGNDACALRLSEVEDYTRVVTRNHRLAATQCEVIVRHLMLPGHLECCTLPILQWLAENLPQALVNIMAQYHPEHRAREFPELREKILRSDHRLALEHARRLGLEIV